MKVEVRCDMCGVTFYKESCRITRHNFCGRKCLADFSSKTRNPSGYTELKDFTKMAENFSRLAKEKNPTRMTPEVREKLRKARLNTGEGKTYTKTYGRHTHRVEAEKVLGRELLPGEVVHHIDGDKRNNSPENLMVFASQSEHARYHAELRKLRKGGDAK